MLLEIQISAYKPHHATDTARDRVNENDTSDTLTSDYSYCRLGDVDFGLAMLCACAGGEQHTILITVIHFL